MSSDSSPRSAMKLGVRLDLALVLPVLFELVEQRKNRAQHLRVQFCHARRLLADRGREHESSLASRVDCHSRPADVDQHALAVCVHRRDSGARETEREAGPGGLAGGFLRAPAAQQPLVGLRSGGRRQPVALARGQRGLGEAGLAAAGSARCRFPAGRRPGRARSAPRARPLRRRYARATRPGRCLERLRSTAAPPLARRARRSVVSISAGHRSMPGRVA